MTTADITAEAFIEVMLCHVPFDGWTETAMHRAADELDLSASEMAALFPQGISGLIEIGSGEVDRNMTEVFMNRYADDLDKMPVHVKIRELLLIRFESLQPHKEAVRKMLVFMSKPAQVKLASSLLYKTLDKVWRVAGDRATDYNFYTKRATLGAVYGATFLAFLGDDTPDMRKTRAFLDRRLKDVANVPKVTKPFRAATSVLSKMMENVARMRSGTGGL